MSPRHRGVDLNRRHESCDQLTIRAGMKLGLAVASMAASTWEAHDELKSSFPEVVPESEAHQLFHRALIIKREGTEFFCEGNYFAASDQYITAARHLEDISKDPAARDLHALCAKAATECWSDLALSRSMEGKHFMAVDAATRALFIDSGYKKALFRRALSLMDDTVGHYQLAQQDLDLYLKERPDDNKAGKQQRSSRTTARRPLILLLAHVNEGYGTDRPMRQTMLQQLSSRPTATRPTADTHSNETDSKETDSRKPALVHQTDSDESDSSRDKGSTPSPTPSALMIKNAGNELFHQKHYTAASRKYIEASRQLAGISKDPAARVLQTQCLSNLALLRSKEGKHKKAVRAATRALAIDPECERALLRRALSAMDGTIRDFSSAGRDLEAYLERRPDDEKSRKTLQMAQVHNHNF